MISGFNTEARFRFKCNFTSIGIKAIISYMNILKKDVTANLGIKPDPRKKITRRIV